MKTSALGRCCIVLSLLAASSTLLLGAVATKESTAPHTAAKNNNHVIETAASDSSANDHRSNKNNEILAALTVQTNKSTVALSEKSAEYTKLQSLFSDKLANFREHHQQKMMQADDTTNNNAMDGTINTEAVYESMDEASLKLVALMKRTEDLTNKIGQFNRAELLGSSSSSLTNENNNHSGGLQERMMNVKQDEIERRDRFVASLMAEQEQQDGSGDDDAENENNEIHANDDDEDNYITITQLDQLLSTDEIITPSDNELQSKLTALAMKMMEQRATDEEEFWKNHFATLPQTIQEHVVKQQQHDSNRGGGECINIPSAVQLVANALNLHYQDGGVGMVDMASYENGGSVVYELTSAPYQPSPRNNERKDDEKKGFGVDKATEQMYHEQHQNDMEMMMNSDEEGGVGIAQKIDMELDKIDMWDWYTHFQLDSIRKYLPDDWERVLDRLSASGYLGTSTNNWGEYTPRGIVDALIPDYIYHAFGISNTASYGSVYGRTASPDVVITAGHSKVGGGGKDGGGVGWSAKPLGNCYPLSMRPENDPILSLLSRDTPSMGAEEIDDDEESENTSLLVGPKYTVRLPYPIHIDAVSIEHRAFPLPRSVLNDGVRGGESAPRWIRVVGFPPCHDDIQADEEECEKFGFDISQPIELGSFEYHPVTVSGREDDYGGGDDVDETSTSEVDRRRRSVQTFVVKGGKVNESGTEEIGGDDDIPNNNEPELEVEDYEIPAGSCAPPKEPDDVPSCGGGATSPRSSDQSERQVVSAVSFIIEENWGNNEYTCLYGVRVHGAIAV